MGHGTSCTSPHPIFFPAPANISSPFSYSFMLSLFFLSLFAKKLHKGFCPFSLISPAMYFSDGILYLVLAQILRKSHLPLIHWPLMSLHMVMEWTYQWMTHGKYLVDDDMVAHMLTCGGDWASDYWSIKIVLNHVYIKSSMISSNTHTICTNDILL